MRLPQVIEHLKLLPKTKMNPLSVCGVGIVQKAKTIHSSDKSKNEI